MFFNTVMIVNVEFFGLIKYEIDNIRVFCGGWLKRWLNWMRHQIKFENKLLNFQKKNRFQSDLVNEFFLDFCLCETDRKSVREWKFIYMRSVLLQHNSKKSISYRVKITHISFFCMLNWNNLFKNQSNVVIKIKWNEMK